MKSTMQPSLSWDRLFSIATRVFVWVLLFGALYVLRSFFLLIFLTFVFVYIQTHAVDRLAPKIKRRATRVILVGILFLSVIVGVFSYVFPRVKSQAEIFAARYGVYLKTLDTQVVKLARNYPSVERIIPDVDRFTESLTPAGELTGWELKSSPSGQLFQQLLGFGGGVNGNENHGREIVENLKKITANILATGSAFLLSLLFSFLIVLDLPRLTASVRGLSDSKLKFIYDEATPTIRRFGKVLGAALEAQLFIAILNTVITALGIWMLGLSDKMAFLSVIVFVCSFIPVAGVFMSSLPICLLALEQGGIALTLFAALMIWIIHMIEAYILNPKIYGHHLHINPVLVLIILTIGGKLFGVWGLVLGLPVCNYIFAHAIREEQK